MDAHQFVLRLPPAVADQLRDAAASAAAAQAESAEGTSKQPVAPGPVFRYVRVRSGADEAKEEKGGVLRRVCILLVVSC